MSRKFNASISLEKFSAFLDGNLPNSEMVAISQEIAKNDFLRSMVDANAETDEILALNSDDIDLESIDENTFELPSINFPFNPEENFELGDIWLDSESSLSINEGIFEDSTYLATAINESFQESSFDENNLEASHQIMKNKVNYGYEPNQEDSAFDWNVYQGNQPSCAIRSQEIILRDYGIMIPQEELIQYAIENGWYSPDPEMGGTPRDATGNLLDAMGIETQRYDNATIFDIISELRAGHRVIVSVDANELWVKNEPKLYKRLFGELSNRLDDKMDELAGVQGANHALIVAGVNVDTDNPSDMKVVLIDSGTGDVCIEYKFSAFKKAWDDSHCHMVATTEPAPFQYNYTTHEMEPSSFQTDFKPSMVSLPDGLSNQFDLPESYFDNYGENERVYNDSDKVLPLGEIESVPEEMVHMDSSSSQHTNDEDDIEDISLTVGTSFSHSSEELFSSMENSDDSDNDDVDVNYCEDSSDEPDDDSSNEYDDY